MVTSQVSPSVIVGNTDVGECCQCDTYDENGTIITHKVQYKLWYCQNPSCKCLCCDEHREPCGYCTGCCAEEHGLGSH